MTPNEALRDGAIRHSIWLERYKTGLAARVLDLLAMTERDLIDRIAGSLARVDGRGYNLKKSATAHLQKLLAEVRAMQQDVFTEIHAQTRDDLQGLARHEASFQKSLLEDSAQPVVSISATLPARTQLNAIVTARPFQGRVLKDWLSSLATDAAERINDKIMIGITEGLTTDQIVKSIMGTQAQNFGDGAMSITRANLQAVVKTATAHVASQAKADLFAANDDLGLKEIYVAVLDTRTSPFCRATDGKVFDVGEGPMTPAHWNCRSMRVAFFGQSVNGKRASMFGPVPETMDYSEWLGKQPREIQEQALGITKAALFRSGGMTLREMVNASTKKAYTLEELRAHDAKAFRAAGLN